MKSWETACPEITEPWTRKYKNQWFGWKCVLLMTAYGYSEPGNLSSALFDDCKNINFINIYSLTYQLNTFFIYPPLNSFYPYFPPLIFFLPWLTEVKQGLRKFGIQHISKWVKKITSSWIKKGIYPTFKKYIKTSFSTIFAYV